MVIGGTCMKIKVFFIETYYLEDYLDDERGEKTEMFAFSDVDIVPGNFVIVGDGAINLVSSAKRLTEIDEFAAMMKEKRDAYVACEVFNGRVEEFTDDVQVLGYADVIEFSFLRSEEEKKKIDEDAVRALVSGFLLGGLN